MPDMVIPPELTAEVELWLAECGSCDAGLPMSCTHPEGDPRRILLRVWRAYEAQAADTKALVETATRLGRELGRREAAEEILAKAEGIAGAWAVAHIAHEIATEEPK